MASYQFVSVATNLPVLLPSIDEAVCQFYGDKVIPTTFHPCYDFLVEVGFGVLLMSSQMRVTQENFDAWVEKRLKTIPSVALTEPKWIKHVEMLRKFLYQEYTFTAWR